MAVHPSARQEVGIIAERARSSPGLPRRGRTRRMRRPTRLHAGLAGGVLAVSCAAILVRLADAPPLAIATWRLALAAAVTGALALAFRRAELAALDGRARALLAGAGLALAV